LNRPTLIRGLPAEAPAVASDEPIGRELPTILWLCGVLAPAVYIATDIAACARDRSFSYVDQAVSELFAISSPTSRLVVPLFTLSSALLLAFALGLWSFATRRVVRLLGGALALSALDALLLWNLFPMHVRGAARSSTDTMHLVFAANPFVVISLILGALAVAKWFRAYSIATTVVVTVLATFGFSYASAIATGGPTPWMGLTERIAQYAYGAWQGLLAVVLVRSAPSKL
jgi:Protein of unknown function (DUF998)